MERQERGPKNDKYKGSYDSVCLPRREGQIIAITTQQSMEAPTRRMQAVLYIYHMSSLSKDLETLSNKSNGQEATRRLKRRLCTLFTISYLF
jgi:hypothetical protein